MSMPRHDPSHRTNGESARLIGSVGALAVALGIGVAVASSPGVAWAGPNDTDSAATSNDPGPSAGGSPSGQGSAGQPSEASTNPDSEPTDADDVDDDDDTVTDPSTIEPTNPPGARSTPTDDAPKKDSNKPHRQPTVANVDRSPIPERLTAVQRPNPDESTADTSSSLAAVDAQQPIQPRALAKVSAVQTVSTLVHQPNATVAHPVAGPVGVVTELVSSLLSVVGLNPQAAGGPASPSPSPTLWAMLGWVRRELGHFSEPAGSAARPAATTSTSLMAPTAAISAVSPLGTQQQLDAERLAAQTTDTLPVALMKLVLRFGFTSAAQQQFSMVGGPDQANRDQLDAAVNEYAMAAAFQQQILNSNQPTVVMQVAPPHTWYGQMVPGSRILYDNPDTIYRFMGVNGASSYVLTGRFADLDNMPADTSFSVLTGLNGITASVLTKDQLVLNDDGTFTITADSSPANGRPNHLQLTADTTLIATRNTLSDWNTEEPMSLAIQRVGGPPNSLFGQLGGFAIPGLGPAVVSNPLLTTLVSLVPPLPFTPPLLRGAVAAVIMALGIQREAQYMAVATTDPTTGERIPPNTLKNPTRNAEFLATQLQSAGYFQLADDEALVVTIDPGNARYFVVPVTNDWTITNDYWNQQTSLNDSQALRNQDDTTYTVVISKADPGVANWVSTGGLNQGTISMRFQDLDPLAPDDLPTVTSQVVKLDELGTVLPVGTVYYDDQQRADQLAIRKAGFDNRFAPFPQP